MMFLQPLWSLCRNWVYPANPAVPLRCQVPCLKGVTGTTATTMTWLRPFLHPNSKVLGCPMSIENKRSSYQHYRLCIILYLCRVPQWKFFTLKNIRIYQMINSRFVILKVITLSYSYVILLCNTRSGHFTSQGLLDHSGGILRPHKALAWVFSWLLKIETKIAKSI